MRCLVRCRHFRRLWRHIGETHQIGIEFSGNVVDSVIDRGVKNREAARRMNSGRLGTWSPHDYQKSSIPLDNGVDRLICVCGGRFMPCPRARCDLGLKTRAHERSDDQHLTHKFAFAPFCSNWGAYRDERVLSAAPLLCTTVLVATLFHWYDKIVEISARACS